MSVGKKPVCPRCGVIDCKKHCNNCGDDIEWRKNYKTGKWQAFNKDSILHRCMPKGNPKYFKDGTLIYDRDTEKQRPSDGYMYTLD